MPKRSGAKQGQTQSKPFAAKIENQKAQGTGEKPKRPPKYSTLREEPPVTRRQTQQKEPEETEESERKSVDDQEKTLKNQAIEEINKLSKDLNQEEDPIEKTFEENPIGGLTEGNLIEERAEENRIEETFEVNPIERAEEQDQNLEETKSSEERNRSVGHLTGRNSTVDSNDYFDDQLNNLFGDQQTFATNTAAFVLRANQTPPRTMSSHPDIPTREVVSDNLKREIARLKTCTTKAQTIQGIDEIEGETIIQKLSFILKSTAKVKPVLTRIMRAQEAVENTMSQWQVIIGFSDGDDVRDENEAFQRFKAENQVDETMALSLNEIDRLEETYEFLQAEHQINNHEREATAPPVVRNEVPLMRSAKLPDIPTKYFDGKRTEWNEFWTYFQNTIDCRQDLTKAAKLQYLIQLMKGSEVTAMVQSYSLTDDNYDIIIDLLKQKYGQIDLTIRDLMRQLMEIQTPTNKSFSYFTEKVQQIIRQLESLGKETNTTQTKFSLWIVSQKKLKKKFCVRNSKLQMSGPQLNFFNS